MKIGIYGGTFDPVHCGHLAVARAARDARSLDRVVLVPVGRPPHKTRGLAPDEDRIEMLRLAVGGEDRLEPSDVEIRREGVSYTVDTLTEFSETYPGDELFFILGEDSLPEMVSWKGLVRIFTLARILVVNRPGYTRVLRPEHFPGVPLHLVERAERDRVTMAPCSVSSTGLRQAIRAGESLDGMVPQEVARYLEVKSLYREC